MGFRSGAAPVAAIAPDGADQVRAWTAFWREQGPDGRCLGAAPPQLYRTLEDHWRRFAATLAPAAEVLDIGCGSGNVARLLASALPSLRVTGIDAARVPTTHDPRVQVLTETAVESLPFADSCFDAAVSQFGFEYSNIEAAAEELARVLAPGARFSFVVHHSESPIVRTSRIHNRALRELTHERVKSLFLSADAAALRQHLQLLEARYPDEQTIRLAAHGLPFAASRGDDETARLWEAVVEAVEPDRILSDALEMSCAAPHELNEWLAPLRAQFELRPATAIFAAGEPLAWKIEGEKPLRCAS